MESVFECEFTPTVKMIAARVRKYSEARYAFLLIISIGLFAYVAINAVFTSIFWGFDMIWVKLLLFTLAFLVVSIFFPRVNAYFGVRNYKKDTAGGLYKIAFGDHIELTQGSTRIIWEYQDIQKIYHLKYSYELVKSKRLALFVDPNGFTKGNFEDFKRFLKEKRPDLTIPE